MLLTFAVVIIHSDELRAQRWPPVDVKPILENWQNPGGFLEESPRLKRLAELTRFLPDKISNKVDQSVATASFIAAMGQTMRKQQDGGASTADLEFLIFSNGPAYTQIASLVDSQESFEKLVELYASRRKINSGVLKKRTIDHPEFSRWLEEAVSQIRNRRKLTPPDVDCVMSILLHACREFRQEAGRFPTDLSELEVRPSDLDESEWNGPYAKVGKDWWGSEFRVFKVSGDKLALGSAGRDKRWKTADDLYSPSNYFELQIGENEELRIDGLYQTCDLATKMARSYKYLKFYDDGLVVWIDTGQLVDPARHEQEIYDRLADSNVTDLNDNESEVAPEFREPWHYRFHVGSYHYENGTVFIEFDRAHLKGKPLGRFLELKEASGQKSSLLGTGRFTFLKKASKP
ncbi:MAG: hypothetical protein Aurels2KO_32500 [Aureliella sp.]